MDVGNLKIKPLQWVTDDMTAIMEETKIILIKMKEIFEGFKNLSELEINEGKSYTYRRKSGWSNTQHLWS